MTLDPEAELVFQSGDTVIVMGKREDIVRFREEYALLTAPRAARRNSLEHEQAP